MEITKEVYNYCLEEKIADAKLIAKWKKQGFEKLCCLMCIQNKNHNFGTTCICRVPKSSLEKGKKFETLGEYADRGLELVSETAADLVGGKFTAVYDNNKACGYCRYSFMCRQKYSAQAEQSTGFDGED